MSWGTTWSTCRRPRTTTTTTTISHDGHHPLPHDCVKCFVFSQLSGSAPAAIAALATVTEPIRHTPFVAIPAPTRTVVATRSRAPPTVL